MEKKYGFAIRSMAISLILSLAFCQASYGSVDYRMEQRHHRKKLQEHKYYTKNGDERVVLYPEISLVHAADFNAFQTYMQYNRETYRSKRTSQLVAESQGPSNEQYVMDSNNQVGILSRTSSGANPVMAGILLNAYEQFDKAYQRFKVNSQHGVAKDLIGQFKTAMSFLN